MSPKTKLRIKWTVGVALLIVLLSLLVAPLPSPLFQNGYSTILQSKEGALLSATIAADQQWRFPPSDSVPKKFDIAIRLFEDEYFYSHPGINPFSLGRALRQNVRAGKVVSGGSTISMQTARMAFGNKRRTYAQKLLEMVSTLKMEVLYSKKSILKEYADHAPFGGNIVGINAASWRYFGRYPSQLSWAEVASLAILPNNPRAIFPGKNDALLLEKRNKLLDKIHSRGHFDASELFLSKQEPLPKKIKPLPNHAYHLLHRSIDEGHGGTVVRSTLNAALQVKATRMVENYSQRQSKNEIHNAAAIILDIQSKETLAYVGNTNNRGDHAQRVDIITAKRSPGSLLKPFLYAMALDDGLITPYQLLPDIPIFYRGFAPKNFDKKYRGAVPASEALTSSLNVPFVHLLIEYGYERFHQNLVQMGLKSFDKPASHYGLSIILGGAETSLWELSSTYAGMARASGKYMSRPLNKGYSTADYEEPHFIQRNSAKDNEPLSSDGAIRYPSIDYTLNVMKELKRPEEESGWEFFGSSRPISWKTGTSFGFRDGWAIGMNAKYLVGVWIGNADGEGRPGLTGVNAAAPLLFDLFDLLGGDDPAAETIGITTKVCSESGMLASKNCLSTKKIHLADYMMNGRNCTYHQIVHLTADQKHRANSSCYPVSNIQKQPWFVLPPVQSWYYKKHHPSYRELPKYLPKCSEMEANQSFQLIYPRQFTRIHIPLEQDGKKGNVIFEAAQENSKGQLYWHLDDQFLGTTQQLHQMAISSTQGIHLLTVIDELGNEIQQRFEILN